MEIRLRPPGVMSMVQESKAADRELRVRPKVEEPVYENVKLFCGGVIQLITPQARRKRR
jgi:hypothetical protein